MQDKDFIREKKSKSLASNLCNFSIYVIFDHLFGNRDWARGFISIQFKGLPKTS